MDDPWGSPWDAAPAATGAKAEGLESFTSPFQDPSHPHDVKNAASAPWEEQEDAWGGWSAPTHTDETWTTNQKTEADPWAQSTHQTDETSMDISSGLNTELVEADQKPLVQEEAVHTTTTLPTHEGTRAPQGDDVNGHTTEDAHKTLNEEMSDTTTAAEETKHSKVQKLVVMYDGLSKPAPSDPSILDDTEQKSAEAYTAETADDDGISIVSDSSKQETAKPDVQVSRQDNDVTVSDHGSANARSSSPKKGTTVPFPINLAILDTLLPNTRPLATPPAQLPDSVIADSFTNVNERKTWYRISRFGSSRKHDQGNDETYRRVTWQNSEVRNKTIRIVRRWMEEDSIAGKVILGKKSAAIGASMFNWDSSEPAIEIDTLLRQKREESRPASRDNSQFAPTAVAVEQDEAAFAWGSSGADTPKDIEPIELPPTETKDLKTPETSRVPSPSLGWSPWDESPKASHRPSSTVPSVPSGLHFSESVAYEAEEDEVDDDDDWGEMVTSQAVQEDSAFEDFPAAAPDQTPSLAALDDSSPITAAEPDFPAPVSASHVMSDWDVGFFDGPAKKKNFESPPSAFEDLETPRPVEERRTLSPPVDKQSLFSDNSQEQQSLPTDLDNILSKIPDLSYMLR